VIADWRKVAQVFINASQCEPDWGSLPDREHLLARSRERSIMRPLIMVTRDLIVIGASAGGLRAIREIALAFPTTLPACVLAVLHISSLSRGLLASVLSQGTALPVKRAEHGDPIRHGRMYIAPPDRHLLVGPRGLELGEGPRENRTRPAIDPLFRSAAHHYRTRVVGVVLTGFLADGTAGLLAIKRAGGVAIVQDPEDAEFPNMPENALKGVPVDYCARLSEIPALLAHLVRERFVERCITLDNPRRYIQSGNAKCSGHDRTASAVLSAQDRRIDDSLSIAARALDERAELLALLADDERAAQRESQAREYCSREQKSRQDAARLRAIATSAPKLPS
jgi:two-component system, chemotaxis family, protein-glutamate methylesterase/glutaminase